MPFRRPTTVIRDTSSVLQGGLSFVAENLHPAARIKVPAVVQMEIVNFADRFLSNWRASKIKSPDLLMDHLNSQAGQRVLLQLELNSDVELERTFLLGDPLRGAFQRDEDKELKELNLNASVRAYADRLILESARQHQSQVSFGHQVMLMTSDQGLARMALAEGLSPIYFRAARADALFGRRLSGTNLHPFDGSLRSRSVPEVLWELATIFGSARLLSPDGTIGLDVHAIGTDLSWAPYHSRDDLLWVTPLKNPGATKVATIDTPQPPKPDLSRSRNEGVEASEIYKEQPKHAAPSFYKLSVDRLFAFVEVLETEQTMAEQRVSDELGVKATSALREYRRFLESAGAVRVEGGAWHSTERLAALSVALRTADITELRKELERYPSYGLLKRRLSEISIGQSLEPKAFGRATATLLLLAELTEIGAPVADRGFFPTRDEMDDKTFVSAAIEAYRQLKNDAGWAETGAWIEELIEHYGLHPVVTRQKLQSMSEAGLLKRVTEGSTTDTKNDRHTVRTLDSKDGHPIVKVNFLYRGDFLIPGKGSSSIRIEEVGS